MRLGKRSEKKSADPQKGQAPTGDTLRQEGVIQHFPKLHMQSIEFFEHIHNAL